MTTNDLQAQISALKAENKRLREALKEIVEVEHKRAKAGTGYDHEICTLATAALSGGGEVKDDRHDS